MPTLTEQQLKQLLSSTPAPGLYLLWGEEKLLLKRAAKKLIQRAGGECFPEFNLNEFPGEAEADRIIDAAVALPFMAEQKCVAVSDYNAEEKPQSELDKLFGLLDDLPESTALVLWYPTLEFSRNSNKWKKLVERCEKLGSVVEFKRRETGDLKRYLGKEAERQGCVLGSRAAGRLIEYAGTDLTALLSEVEKLCAYTLAQGGKEISAETVEELTPKSTEITVFLMTNALVAGNYEKTYTLLDQLFYQNEEPVAILAAMASSYLDMFRVKAALESGLTCMAPADYAPEYKRLGFRLEKAMRSAARVPMGTLHHSLNLLLEADLALKGSRLDSRLVLDSLIARLLLAGQEAKR